MPLLIVIIGLAAPLLELAVLIKVGQSIGFWKTLLLIIGMAALGAFLLYRQGWKTLMQAQNSMVRGEPPVAPMLDGTLLGVAGFLLLAPGLISDVFGLLLLIPPLRHALARRMLKHFDVVDIRVDAGPSASRPRSGDGRVIDGEFERLDEGPVRPRSVEPRSDRSPR
jgi:UPF0716 protein FxsA